MALRPSTIAETTHGVRTDRPIVRRSAVPAGGSAVDSEPTAAVGRSTGAGRGGTALSVAVAGSGAAAGGGGGSGSGGGNTAVAATGAASGDRAPRRPAVPKYNTIATIGTLAAS